MNPEEIAAILEKAVEGALNVKKPESKTDDTVMETLGGIAKAITAINAKVEKLEKTTVKEEPETVESSIEKLAKSVQAIADEVKEIKNPTADEDKPLDVNKMTKKDWAELIKGVVKPESKGEGEEASPKGQGKDNLDSEIKKIADGGEGEVEVDISDIEAKDPAGNERSNEARKGIKALDDYFGKVIGSTMSAKFGSNEVNDDDDDDDDDE
jgi:hypothetical protein